MLTPSLEDFLEEIYRFSLSLDTVRVTVSVKAQSCCAISN
ncbi:hypothetical protein DSBG_4191 [Desulfosporosinus sp. BG]|nr:hypothetical protein DSBG_4191 [Desulfosporosinus sp. BG]